MSEGTFITSTDPDHLLIDAGRSVRPPHFDAPLVPSGGKVHARGGPFVARPSTPDHRFFGFTSRTAHGAPRTKSWPQRVTQKSRTYLNPFGPHLRASATAAAASAAEGRPGRPEPGASATTPSTAS